MASFTDLGNNKTLSLFQVAQVHVDTANLILVYETRIGTAYTVQCDTQADFDARIAELQQFASGIVNDTGKVSVTGVDTQGFLNDKIMFTATSGLSKKYDATSGKLVIDLNQHFISQYLYIEQDTGMLWVDNSKIYQKTIAVPLLPSESVSIYASCTMKEDVSIVKIEGFGTDGSTQIVLPNKSIEITYHKYSNSSHKDTIEMTSDKDYSSFKGYVTIYYVKENV